MLPDQVSSSLSSHRRRIFTNERKIFTWVWGWASLHMLIPLSGVSILHPPAFGCQLTLCKVQDLVSTKRYFSQSQVTAVNSQKDCRGSPGGRRGRCRKQTQRGAREIARMKERDKVEFKRKRAEMFPGWGNHSEILRKHVFSQDLKSHGAGSHLTGMWVWFEVC